MHTPEVETQKSAQYVILDKWDIMYTKQNKNG